MTINALDATVIRLLGGTTTPVFPPAGAPHLAFSDVISGPVGVNIIGDGLGDGIIVTVWGFNLASTQGSNKVIFEDSALTEFDSDTDIHVYYWKNADNTGDSGPADLYASHSMQEVCFSMPAGAVDGVGKIKLDVGGVISTFLNFEIRSTGSVYHVKPGTGPGDGSWADPFETLAEMNSSTSPQMGIGDTVYVHTLTEGSPSASTGFNFDVAFDATLNDQFAMVAYPGEVVTVQGITVMKSEGNEGIVWSKFVAEEYWNGTDSGNNGILGPGNWGRVIGCRVDNPVKVEDGYGGAISNGQFLNKAPGFEGGVCMGNYVVDYGNVNCGKSHHTTYFTMRDDGAGLATVGMTVAYNYLLRCFPRFGIHIFDTDQYPVQANLTGDCYVHDNVIVDQGDAGISLQGNSYWTQDYYAWNNVLINTGKNTAGGSSSIGGFFCKHDGGVCNLYNNTIYNWDEDAYIAGEQAAVGNYDAGIVNVDDNIFYIQTDGPDRKWTYEGGAGLQGGGNAWILESGGDLAADSRPGWDTNKIIDETEVVITRNGSKLNMVVTTGIDGQSTSGLARDVYGAIRETNHNTGAIESAV